MIDNSNFRFYHNLCTCIGIAIHKDNRSNTGFLICDRFTIVLFCRRLHTAVLIAHLCLKYKLKPIHTIIQRKG